VITATTDKCFDLADIGHRVMEENITAGTKREAAGAVIPIGWLIW
jgi:hypothetical protein